MWCGTPRSPRSLVLASIDDVARKFVEGLMIDIKNWEPQSDFAKHWKREGRTEAAHAVCTALGIAWTPAREARVSGASAAELERCSRRSFAIGAGPTNRPR
jgi:hypothetical protein